MVDKSQRKELLAGCAELPCGEPGAEAIDRLLNYLDLLTHWNKTYNLTAVRTPGEMVSRHLLDSLSVLPYTGNGRVLDAGTGAGLPGVPLAIMKPDNDFTLLDSAGKKIRFLRHVKRTLRLNNIHPEQQRLETFETDITFASIISRAFSSLADFASAAQHLMGPATRLLAMKGHYPEPEIKALPAWIKLQQVEKLVVPGLHEERHLVIMSLSA